MSYIIVDLEFNNMKNITKYYENFYEKYKTLKDIDIENEIIEIGAVKYDEHMKEISSLKEYITPSIFPIINPAVNDITKIDMEILNEKGISFSAAFDKLSELFDEDDILCSWAKDDIVELIINAQYHKYENTSFIKKYLDLQEYITKILGHKKVLGLKNALNELRIKVDEAKLHDAFYDAQCTGNVFKRLYNSRIIKDYVVSDIYNMPALNIENLNEFKLDENKIKIECPKCRKRIERDTDINLVKWRFVTVGICPKCRSNIMCEIYLKKSFNGEIFYEEISSIINNEIYERYCYKFNSMNNKLNF